MLSDSSDVARTGHPSVQIPPTPLSLFHLDNITLTPTLVVSLEVLLTFGQQAFEKKRGGGGDYKQFPHTLHLWPRIFKPLHKYI